MPVSEELRTNLSEGTDNAFKVKREEESDGGGDEERFDMDDGYAVGPPDEVFAAVERFRQAVRALGPSA